MLSHLSLANPKADRVHSPPPMQHSLSSFPPLQVQGITLGYLFPQNHSMNFSSNGRKRFPILCLSTPSPSPINTKGFNYPGNLSSGVLLESCSGKRIPEPPGPTDSFLVSRSHWQDHSLRHSWGWFALFLGRIWMPIRWGQGCLVVGKRQELDIPSWCLEPGTSENLLHLAAT